MSTKRHYRFLSYGSLAAEHKHTRTAASIFDVSHMVQSELKGKGSTAFLQWLTPSSIAGLQHLENRFFSTLSVLLNTSGGIIDDLMVTRQGDEKSVSLPR